MKKITKAELKKRNAEFNALPPLKKRVAVAKDVLLQLKKGTFLAGSGYGMPLQEYQDRSNYSFFPTGSLQVAVVDGLKCEGCAKALASFPRRDLVTTLQSAGIPVKKTWPTMLYTAFSDSTVQTS